MQKSILVAMLLASFSAFGAQQFGMPGMNGRDAINGTNGANGESQTVDVDGSAIRIDAEGENGGNASLVGEDGDPATSCQQPLNVPFDLIGAPGGDGGAGGRGGHGGRGGDVNLRIKTDAELIKLKKISISNVGGRAGTDIPLPGRGAPGCPCLLAQWSLEFCRFEKQRIENGTIIHSYEFRTEECRWREQGGNGHHEGNGHRDGNGHHRGNGEQRDGREWHWAFVDSRQENFQCAPGRSGSNGNFSRAQNGDYGLVSVSVGSGEVPNGLSFKGTVSQLVGKSFVLSGYMRELRSGLRSLLGRDSNVSDTFNFGRFTKRIIRFEWLPKKSPEESGVGSAIISAKIGGTTDAPQVSSKLPVKLTSKVSEKDGVTLVTITHVLNSTDPKRIEFCAKHNAKGSMVCEFNGQCIYEDGDCLPR